jgi:hypothetical protein
VIPAPDITPELLRKLLRYEPDTGKLFWLHRPREMFTLDREFKRWNNRYAGTEASYDRATGYRGAFVFRKSFSAHRLAWAIHYNEWPTGDLDHINGVRDDNRIANLRVVTRTENARNAKRRCTNKSGVTGVIWYRGKWRAYIVTHLGLFDTLEEAAAARKAEERRLGFHENHGRGS